MKLITQSEGRRLRKQVKALQGLLVTQHNEWRGDWKRGWVEVDYVELAPVTAARLETARKLGHALIIVPDLRNCVHIYADRLQP